MLEKSTCAALRRIANPTRRHFVLARRAFASSLHQRLVHVSVIAIACALTAAVAQAQDRPAIGLERTPLHDRNRIVEIPANGPDSGLETGAGINAEDSGAAEDNQEAGQPDPGQGPGDSEDGPAKFADLDQFSTNDDVYESPIGASLQHNCTRLAQRQVACGLAVLEVRPGSPAAAAGMRPYSGLVHTLLGAAVVSASMFFPPAFAALGFVDHSHVGESFDLIIGVDGQRIHKIPDFQGALSNVRFGDVIYLTIVRGGKRLQIAMRLTR